MSTALWVALVWVALVWIVLSAVVGVWVGLILRARDAQVPSGPRVRIEYRGCRPWGQR